MAFLALRGGGTVFQLGHDLQQGHRLGGHGYLQVLFRALDVRQNGLRLGAKSAFLHDFQDFGMLARIAQGSRQERVPLAFGKRVAGGQMLADALHELRVIIFAVSLGDWFRIFEVGREALEDVLDDDGVVGGAGEGVHPQPGLELLVELREHGGPIQLPLFNLVQLVFHFSGETDLEERLNLL